MIEVNALSKNYRELIAVSDLSFKVAPGEILGFLGPNGAGKTTTMRIIAGFIAPSSGSAAVCGHDVVREPLPAGRRARLARDDTAFVPAVHRRHPRARGRAAPPPARRDGRAARARPGA